MYLKKLEGPRVVSLPDGSTMSRADLPGPDTRRWVASRKAAIVRAVAAGLIARPEALQRYGLSEEELAEWERAVLDHGIGGLKVTRSRRAGEEDLNS